MSQPLAVANAASTGALAVASPWSRSLTLPPLGNLDAYISAVNRLPLLTLEEEHEAARRLRDHNDLDAAGREVAVQIGTAGGRGVMRLRDPEGQLLTFVACAPTWGL
mgnify:CR=1 FL=1